MGSRFSIGVLFLMVFGLQACVADQKLQSQNALLQDELKHFQLQLYEADQRIKSQDSELKRLQQAEAKCNQNLADLKVTNASLQKINLKLNQMSSA